MSKLGEKIEALEYELMCVQTERDALHREYGKLLREKHKKIAEMTAPPAPKQCEQCSEAVNAVHALKEKLAASEREVALLRTALENCGVREGWLSPELKEFQEVARAEIADLKESHAQALQAERERVRELCVATVGENGCSCREGSVCSNCQSYTDLKRLDLTPPAEPQKAAQEPRTNHYCAKCGLSPEAAEHEFSHCYQFPKPSGTPKPTESLRRAMRGEPDPDLPAGEPLASSPEHEPAGPPYKEAWLNGGCMVCGNPGRDPEWQYVCSNKCFEAVPSWGDLNAWISACDVAKYERENGGGK
jgi:hypothetical protein